MLRELRIRNFAIIDVLELICGNGLHVFTGETGAGKSIIVGALNLLLGGRATPDCVRSGCDESILEARFALPASEPLTERLHSLGLDPLDEPAIVIRRIISRADRSRVTINGQMATVSQLSRLCAGLVHIHGQQDHSLLLSAPEQLELLDRFGGLLPQRDEYHTLFARYQDLNHECARLDDAEREAAQKIDFLEFQLSELEDARLACGEDDSLESELARLRYAAQLTNDATEGLEILTGESGSLISGAGRVEKLIRSITQIDPTLASSLAMAESVTIQLTEMAQTLRAYAEGVASDPERLVELDDRLALIRRFKKKYGCARVDELLNRTAELREELEQWRGRGARQVTVAAERDQLKRRLDECAGRLSQGRIQAAERFGRKIERELSQLKMAQTACVIQCRSFGSPNFERDGWDQIEFLVRTNKGEELKPLRKVASGGELSRVMLAIKSVLGSADQVPVLIFDEVDVGIGGAVAELVGRRLKSLARGRQVLCITHLPQIAAFADHHFIVEKVGKRGRSVATLQELGRTAQVAELARMVGGSAITAATRRHAEELLIVGQSSGE